MTVANRSNAEVAEAPAQIAAWLRERLAPGARLTSDSRAVRRGDAFLAFAGARTDGRRFIESAVAAGAAAVLWQRDAGQWPQGIDAAVTQRAVLGLARQAGRIAAEYYGRPSERMDLIAVTGTNGKTSCTQWIAQGLNGLPGRDGATAVIGTLGSGRLGALDPFGLTTPDSVSLQTMLAGFAADGVTASAIEASSIGLDQGRLDGARVTAAVFTNLTHDHLDYHGTMSNYAAAKARLFGFEGLRVAVVNGDDPFAATMLAAIGQRQPPMRIGYTLAPTRGALAVDAWLQAENVRATSEGLALTIGGDFGRAAVDLRLLGRFNAANALAVAGTWIGLGMSFEQAIERLAALRPVPGRIQMVESVAGGPGPLAVIDYAHTPDALESVLHALRAVADARGGRLWCVFGAGGDRDPSKRPRMGAAAERGADHLALTSDNPRGESPEAIIEQIRAGLRQAPAIVEVDRAAAIRGAIARASRKDVVLIAGKGHEPYQEIASRRIPFSDLDQAWLALAARAESVDV